MEFSIDSNQKGQRLDRILRKLFKNNQDIKLSDIYSWIRKGAIKVNDHKKKENYRVQEGDKLLIDTAINSQIDPVINLEEKDSRLEKVNLKELQEQILFENQNWIFWNKPFGIPVHPGKKYENTPTLNDYLHHYLKNTSPESLQSPAFTPSFCFRLDKNTSGVIVAAKNYEALKYLNELIREKKTEKLYTAVVTGDFPENKQIDMPISHIYDKYLGRKKSIVDEKQGKKASTQIKRISVYNDKYLGSISLLNIKILTGRMHQIRVHLQWLGYPIIGDLLYGNKDINSLANKKYHITRQLLHSSKYSFFDTFQGKKVEVKAPLPPSFKNFSF